MNSPALRAPRWRRSIATAIATLLTLSLLPTIAFAADYSKTDVLLTVEISHDGFTVGQASTLELTIQNTSQTTGAGENDNRHPFRCVEVAHQGFSGDGDAWSPAPIDRGGSASTSLELTPALEGPYELTVRVSRYEAEGCSGPTAGKIHAVTFQLASHVSLADPRFTFELGGVSATYGDAPIDVSSSASTVEGAGDISFSSTSEVCEVSGAGMVTILGAGGCEVTASLDAADGFADADDITSTLNIARAPLTVTPDPLSATISVTDELPTFVPSYDGFVGGDDESVIVEDATCQAWIDVAWPGTYEVFCWGGDAGPNYVLQPGPEGEMIVDMEWALPEGMTAIEDGFRVTYGAGPFLVLDLLPAPLDELVEELLEWELIQFRTDDENVCRIVDTELGPELALTGTGVCTLTGELQLLQAADFQTAEVFDWRPEDLVLTLEVVPATVTVTTLDRVMNVGDDLPEFAPIYDGFVDDDASVLTTAATCTTEATGELAGEFDIVCSGAEADHHVFEYMPGTLTVADTADTIIDPPIELPRGDGEVDDDANRVDDDTDDTTTEVDDTDAAKKVLAKTGATLTALLLLALVSLALGAGLLGASRSARRSEA
jgi:hypothetical protein